MKVLMLPHLSDFKDPGSESGIRRVIEAYFKYLPQFGCEMLPKGSTDYDVLAVHAGCTDDYRPDEPMCCHNHGLYWSAMYDCSDWEYGANANVIRSIRYAKEVTVPSSWVAGTFRRDMHLMPHVVPHGIDWNEWQDGVTDGEFVIGYNKNRRGADVCNPEFADELARRFPSVSFVNTFSNSDDISNINLTGLISHKDMMRTVKECSVYVSTVKETGGIGILEAMAAGKPILGFAQGGIMDWCEHGVNSYLAAPGDIDGLVEGLEYCLAHRKVLGANSREMAKQFTWEKAAEKVAEVYRLIAEGDDTDKPLVTVTVPCFNYGHLVTTIIDSIKAQTLNDFECFVVNDGSTDNSEEAILEAIKDDKRFHYVKQANSGVSIARNHGISLGSAPFVCCIDSDDQIDPTFLEKLVPHLQADNSLGLVYSGLKLLLPRGDEILELNSQWPHECDFDEQVKGHNQVPTCCLFKRKCWERLGGYRQRYGGARGCGTEDAEFWLRIGAHGWGIKQATTEPLFRYLLGGRTSGDKEYKEVNYLQWHPWTVDGQHPFASIATPVNHSHRVRYYDEPIISIVIPVGPGHETDVIDALDSLEAQTFRLWEAIIVDDTGDDKLDMTGFPFVRLVKTDGRKGAGYARNRGTEVARGRFLLFQDADDWLYPDALWRMLEEYGSSDGEVAIYGDADGLAVISEEYARKMEGEHRLLQYRPEDGHALIRNFSADYDWARASQQPDPNGNFYLWCNINTLIPTHWHEEVGGFDEQMDSWEDWDYWIRLARLGKCFVHIHEPFFVYRFYTGSRRWAAHPEHEQGLQLARNLVQYMIDKYSGGDVVPCTRCGGSRRRPTVVNDYPSMITQVTRDGIQTGGKVNDTDFVLCEYLGQPPGNKSDHSLVGVTVFPEVLSGVPMIRRKDGWSIDYRYKKAGDRFLVHREDLQRSPHWFRAVELDKSNFDSVLPKQRTAPPSPPPEPESLAETLEKAVQVPGMTPPPTPVQEPVTPSPTLTAPTPTPQSPAPDEPISEEVAVKSMMTRVLTATDLQSLPGVTKGIAEQMAADGVSNYQDILDKGVQGLQEYKGVADTRAMMMVDAINAMVLNAA